MGDKAAVLKPPTLAAFLCSKYLQVTRVCQFAPRLPSPVVFGQPREGGSADVWTDAPLVACQVCSGLWWCKIRSQAFFVVKFVAGAVGEGSPVGLQ